MAVRHAQSVPEEAARPARAGDPDFAASSGQPNYRVVATDPSAGKQVFVKLATEEAARGKAREFERLIGQTVPTVGPQGESSLTVAHLAERYVADHLSGLWLRYREKEQYLLRWVLGTTKRCCVVVDGGCEETGTLVPSINRVKRLVWSST